MAVDTEQSASSIEIARAIIDHHMNGTPLAKHHQTCGDYPLIDAQTANAIVTVHDGLSPANAARFAAMDLLTAGTVAWKIIGKAQGR